MRDIKTLAWMAVPCFILSLILGALGVTEVEHVIPITFGGVFVIICIQLVVFLVSDAMGGNLNEWMDYRPPPATQLMNQAYATSWYNQHSTAHMSPEQIANHDGQMGTPPHLPFAPHQTGRVIGMPSNNAGGQQPQQQRRRPDAKGPITDPLQMRYWLERACREKQPIWISFVPDYIVDTTETYSRPQYGDVLQIHQERCDILVIPTAVGDDYFDYRALLNGELRVDGRLSEISAVWLWTPAWL